MVARTLLAITATKGVTKVLPEINLDIFALVDGVVKFERKDKDRKQVSVYEEIAQ